MRARKSPLRKINTPGEARDERGCAIFLFPRKAGCGTTVLGFVLREKRG